MQDVKEQHKKDLEEPWRQYVDKLPDGLKEEILRYE